jgi:cyclase
MKDGGLYKTQCFAKPVYVGDPINAMRIFNDKEVDEIVLLDIGATAQGRAPDFERIADIVSESFMPLAYGGGISTYDDAMRLFEVGIEKVVLGTAAFTQPELISRIAQAAGGQAVVVSVDVKKPFFSSPRVFVSTGKKNTKLSPVEYAKRAVEHGAGELMLTSITHEGKMAGYDIELIREVAGAVSVPVIAHGGAGTAHDLKAAIHEGGASAVAAGSLFVFQGPHRAVLISYPSAQEIEAL